jgi:hypothetical protein
VSPKKSKCKRKQFPYHVLYYELAITVNAIMHKIKNTIFLHSGPADAL